MPFQVPGIGYAGLGQQTAAAQMTFRKAMGGSTTRRKSTGAKRKVKVRGRSRTRSARLVRRIVRTRRGDKPARMVKGSAAAKRHMAKLRRMRKR